jgi:flagellar hook-associated protein 3 FlgL
MQMIQTGDLARTLLLTRQGSTLKARLDQASVEVATGRVADVGRHLAGDLGQLAAIDHARAAAAGRLSAARDADLVTRTMQEALARIAGAADDTSAALLLAASAADGGQLAAATRTAAQAFDDTVRALGTTALGRSLFSGTATDRAPLPAAEEILAALTAALPPGLGADGVAAAVRGWFAAPTGFAALYRGGPAEAMALGPGESAEHGLTAADPALRGTLAALATAALVDRGLLAGQPAARADLVRAAGEGLVGAAAGRTEAAARLGLAEARIEQVRLRAEAEGSALDIARAGLVAADPYEAATRLQQTETQLQSLYTVTARLARLSLAEYL